MVYFVFIILWVVTFLPAWYLLLKLIAYSSSSVKLLSTKFLSSFVLYQLIIALPYVYLLVFGYDNLPDIIKLLAFSSIAVGLVLSIIRLFFANQVNSVLWSVYGRVYDGLLDFYPYQKLQETVAEATDATKQMDVLDLGCGSGNQSMVLSQTGAKIVAVDNSKSMLRQFRKKVNKNSVDNIKIIDSDLQSYMSENKTQYDRIVLVNVLYTVQDRDKLLRDLLNALKPDGQVIITNSDKGGNGSLIKEHIDNKGFFSLLKPRLIGVFIIDSLISELAKSGHFSFVSEKIVVEEVERAGGIYEFLSRCYGDVNILFKVTKSKH